MSQTPKNPIHDLLSTSPVRNTPDPVVLLLEGRPSIVQLERPVPLTDDRDSSPSIGQLRSA